MLRKERELYTGIWIMLKEKLLNKQSKYTIFYDAFKSSKNAAWTQNTQKNTEGVFQLQLAKKEKENRQPCWSSFI